MAGLFTPRWAIHYGRHLGFLIVIDLKSQNKPVKNSFLMFILVEKEVMYMILGQSVKKLSFLWCAYQESHYSGHLGFLTVIDLKSQNEPQKWIIDVHFSRKSGTTKDSVPIT